MIRLRLPNRQVLPISSDLTPSQARLANNHFKGVTPWSGRSHLDDADLPLSVSS